jgi:uncharacterized phage-associated protein
MNVQSISFPATSSANGVALDTALKIAQARGLSLDQLVGVALAEHLGIVENHRAKLRNVVLALIGDLRVERRALYRLVYFADIVHCINHGATIINASHYKVTHGPVPNGFVDIRRAMVNDGALDEQVNSDGMIRTFFYTVSRPELLEAARALLPDDALKTIDLVRCHLGGRSGGALGEILRRFAPWTRTDFGETLKISLASADLSLRNWLDEVGMLKVSGS